MEIRSHSVALIFVLLLIPNIAKADIRNPASERGQFIANVAVNCTATCYPQERLKDSGSQWDSLDISDFSLYNLLMKTEIAQKGGNPAYASCTQYVCAVLSTVDDDIWKASTNSEVFYEYVMSHPHKYKCLGNVPFTSLREGDLLVTKTHTAIFVGDETQKKYKGALGNIAEAGYHTHSYPGIDLWYTLGRHTLGELDPWKNYLIFRVR